MSDLVTTLDHGAVRELRLSRPPVNALDPALSQAIAAEVSPAEQVCLCDYRDAHRAVFVRARRPCLLAIHPNREAHADIIAARSRCRVRQL